MASPPLLDVARSFRAPVPPSVLAAAARRDVHAELVDALARGDLLQDDAGLVRANPLLGGPSAGDLAAAWPPARAWLADTPWPDDASLVEGIRLALDAGDRDGARGLLRRLALGTVPARSAAPAARALVDQGLVRPLLGLERETTLLLLVDGGRGEEALRLFTPEERWLLGRRALVEGRLTDALEFLGPRTEGELWFDIVAVDALCRLGRVDEGLDRLTSWVDDGRVPASLPPLLQAELLRISAWAHSEAMDLRSAATARAQLDSLAERHREPRLQLVVRLGYATECYRLGRFEDARRWLARFDALVGDRAASRLTDVSAYLSALLIAYRGEDPRAIDAYRGRGADMRPFWEILDGYLLFVGGHPEEARTRLADALARPGAAAPVLAAEIALFQGRLDEAAELLRDLPPDSPAVDSSALVHAQRLAWLRETPAPAAHRPFQNLLAESLALLHDAERALASSSFGPARDTLGAARVQIEEHRHGRLDCAAWALTADLQARSGDLDAARGTLQRAEDRLRHGAAPEAGLIEAARAALDDVPPTPDQWTAWTARRDWRALTLAARDFPAPDDAAAVLDSLPPRLITLGAAAFPRGGTADALHAALDGSWFTAPGGERQDLSRRKALRGLVAAFVARRSSTPGATLSVDDLLDAGWPGEQIQPLAGRNRVHVALNTLRELGLRGILQSSEGGYALSTDVPIAVHEDPV